VIFNQAYPLGTDSLGLLKEAGVTLRKINF
jgi:hypothetical protein